MKKIEILLVLALLVSALPCALASGPVIGLAISQGNLEVDRASVAGNTNLNNGAELKTGKDLARIQLSNGGRATLGANSQGKVYAGYLALERGEGLVASPSAYALQAKGMTVTPGSKEAVAHVAVKGNAIWVSAINGPVKVAGADGVIMARVEAGKGLSFEPSTAATSVSTMTGQLRSENGQFRLKDEISNLDVVVTGGDLTKSVGKRVQVTGAAKATADGESQIITLAKVSTLENENAGGGQTGSGRAARAGLSKGAKIGIITAIGVGAAVGIIVANIS